MIQATTPTITLTLPNDIDLTTATEVFVTFKQQMLTITKTTFDGVEIDDENANVLYVTLEQSETVLFSDNYPAKVQVNWTQGTKRFATVVKNINVKENLIPKMLGVI